MLWTEAGQLCHQEWKFLHVKYSELLFRWNALHVGRKKENKSEHINPVAAQRKTTDKSAQF